MTDQRKFSRKRHQIKVIHREEVENRLRATIFAALMEEAPTSAKNTVDVISEVVAAIASQLLTQTQATHRALATLGDDAVDYGTEFVIQLVAEARKDADSRFKRKTVVPPTSEGSLALADDWAGPVAGPTDIERHFGIPRSTLYRWQKRNEIVFLNTRSSKKPVFPLKQFVDGRPAAGIAEVIKLIPDLRVAWQWLVAPHSELDKTAPLDKLLAGEVEMVLRVAHGHTITTS